MSLKKYVLAGIWMFCSICLFAQPVWQVNPQNLELTCQIGTDYSLAIQDWLDNNGNGSFTAGCGGPMVINNFNGLSPDCAGADSVLVSFLVTDSCNESAEASAWIAINDNFAPTFNETVEDVTISCNQNPPDLPAITINDICDPNPSLTIELDSEQTSNGSCTDVNYVLERRWIATDACGNVDTLKQRIFFEDSEGPTFDGPADLTITCEMSTDTASTGAPTNISDNCSGTTFVEFEDFTFFQGCSNQYTLTRLWKVLDACGNESDVHEQTILVQDFSIPQFTAPISDTVFNCSNPAAAEAAFQAWIANHAGAVAVDNCTPTNELTWFAATPGSYSINNPSSWPGTSPGTLNPGSCAASINGIIRSEAVDFVVYDECQRVTRGSATFFVVDQTAPLFSYCPTDITLNVEDNTCEIDWTMILPDIDETCDNSFDNFSNAISQVITSESPGNETIVNPVNLTMSGLPTPPSTPTQSVEVIITLVEVDAELSTEFFNIYLSDGSFVGQTNSTDAQCGNSQTSFLLSPQQFQLLTLDGNFSVDLVPNIPNNQTANFGINDICSNSQVSMSVDFEYEFPSNFEVNYSIDGQPAMLLNFSNAPTTTFGFGNHTVEFFATDCAGNESSCQYNIFVRDGKAPSITCPDDIEYSLAVDDDCVSGPFLELEFPIFIEDDCSYLPYSQTQPTTPADALITFEYDPDYLEYVAQEKTYTFTNVQADVAGTTVKLVVEVNGDNQNEDDYFLIYGDDGNILGATRVGLPNVTYTPGACPSVIPKAVAEIYFSSSTYLEWAQDGVVNISVRPNRNFNIPPPGVIGDGINPICTVFPNGTADGSNDGQSNVFITLETQTAPLIYSVAGATNIAATTVPYPQGVPSLNFAIGESTVTYSISDQEGNSSNCSFNVKVTDDIAPVAVCQATTIFINPSGLVNYQLLSSEIEAGSTDNCEIVSTSVSPNTFSCEDIGKDTLVTLTVVDAAGNEHSCSTLMAIEGELAKPNYSISLCGNDSLFLFANPPAATGGIIYTYQWSGPNNFTSTLENPIILNASMANAGSYSVTVMGITGCATTATMEVTLNSDLAQPTISQPGLVCAGADLTLFVNIADGDSYTWIAPNFSTTQTLEPFLLIPNIDESFEGNWSVEVLRNGCFSPPAIPVSISVEALPNILANNNSPVCEGTQVQLSANNIPGASYQWSGPNGFSSLIRNPIAAAVAGDYTVTAVSPNGCSAMAVTSVSVLENPQIDDIVFSGATCVDGTTDIQLTSSVSGGQSPYQYNWAGPVPTGSGSILSLVNVTSAVNGEYQLISTDQNGCVSLPHTIDVALTDIPSTPQISGATAVCQGADVLLTTDTYLGATTYTWLTETNQFMTSQASLLLENLTDSTIVQVFVSVDGCSSLLSPIVQIPVSSMLEQPTITGPSQVCSGETIQLETINIPGATYIWTGPAGFSASVYNPVVFQSGVQNEGNYQVLIEDEGCSSPLSESFFVTVNENPPTPIATGSEAICLDDPDAEISLTVAMATAIPGANYTWFNAQDNTQIGDPVSTLTFSFAPDANLMEGIAEFYVLAEHEGCGSTQSLPIAVELFEIPEGEAFAGDDFLLCDGLSVTLDATAPIVGSGVWVQSGGPTDAILANPLDPNSVLTNLQNGQTYAYDWILSNGACVDYDQATVNITFETIPQANDDVVVVPFAGATSFNVKDNDQIDIQFFIEVIEGPFEGDLLEIEEGEFTYQAEGNFAGEDYMIYQVCNQKCPESCTSARVDFKIGENATCDVPTIFTPNEDGTNDTFVIPCLAGDQYPSNRVVIFNQYGDEVFGASPYENDWRGTFNGEELPVGTYYYVVEYGNGTNPISGFIILER